MLLSHRSGLPNYVYFMDRDRYWRGRVATNNDMLQYMIDKKPALYGYPNRGFHYCNTNFALLALIVEKVSGQSFSGIYEKYSFHAPWYDPYLYFFKRRFC